MVNNGRPSRGCQMCRTRRIKCDESKPTCRRCAESRRECPGYKSEHELLFRDETLAVKRRAQKLGKKSAERLQNPGKDAKSRATPSPTASVSSSLVSQSMPQASVEEQASCHLISNFVLVPRQEDARGFMDFLIPLKKIDNPPPQHFKCAFEACALASLNSRVGLGNEFEKETTGKYIQALSLTFAALRDPKAVKEDSTLAAVLLLGLFESLRPTRGLLPWGSHIEGANQLVKARGLEQLRTSVGRGMFMASRTQMIIHCSAKSTRASMGVDWWMSGGAKNMHASECQRLNIGLRDLEVEANQLLGDSTRSSYHIQEVSDLLLRCRAHDMACADWERNLPGYFQFETVAWEAQASPPDGNFAKAEVYPGRVDAYDDLWVLSVRNMMRCGRLLLATVLTRCAAWLSSPEDYRFTKEYATALQLCTDTITDIIASIPYQLGWVSKHSELTKSPSSFGCGEDSAQKGLGGYFAMWHLACVCIQDYTTDSQRAWAHGRLQYIRSELGVRSADYLTGLDVRLPSKLIYRDELISSPSARMNYIE